MILTDTHKEGVTPSPPASQEITWISCPVFGPSSYLGKAGPGVVPR
jgi:hypothetical protein